MSAPSSGTRNFHMIEAVPERLEGAPRQFRRRWSDEFKEHAVAEAMEPGASVSAIAHRIGIHPSQLFGWRRDARERERSASSGAAVCTQAGSGGSNSVIDVVIGDVVIRAGPDVDAAHLQRVIRAVLSA
ncbi:transposase [Agrobacterium tumefaciens]|jgi:transposase|nr:transposase [Agrobacterium tumefaciens]NTF34840.1 transposase [Rhizobium skierniewicense]